VRKFKKLNLVPRIIINHAKQPFEIPSSPRSVWICGCGLSKRPPLCDGSHTQLKKEGQKEFWIYDAVGKRHRISRETAEELQKYDSIRKTDADSNQGEQDA
jgi:CDGSH-type Zn-finger protein